VAEGGDSGDAANDLSVKEVAMVTRSAKVRGVVVSLCLVATALWTQPSWAADRAFAKITGSSQGVIEGDSTFNLAPKSIEVLNTGFGMEVPPSAKPVVGPLTLLKRFDRASPKLLLAAFTAESLLVEINWFMDQTGQRTVSLVLDGAAITKIDAAAQLDGTSASGFETVSLSYTRITFTSRVIDASGKVSGTVMVCLDVAAGKVC